MSTRLQRGQLHLTRHRAVRGRALALLSVAIVLPALGASCSSYQPPSEPPPPRVQPAPYVISHVAFHVFQLVTPPQTPEDDWDYRHMPGYTNGLRQQFQTQLQLAGFTVILDRKTPPDIVATIQSDMPHEQTGVATLVLTRGGQVIDRFSVPVRVAGEPPRTVHLVGEAAVRLVEAVEKSAAVARIAREVAPPAIAAPTATATAPAGLTVAGETCPPEPGLPPEPEPPLAECVIERTVRCQGASPVLDQRQPEPFVECPREIPFKGTDVLAQRTAKFSPRETRARRLAGKCGATPRTGDCCYLQFDTKQCR